MADPLTFVAELFLHRVLGLAIGDGRDLPFGHELEGVGGLVEGYHHGQNDRNSLHLC